jgi:hypothetical protein
MEGGSSSPDAPVVASGCEAPVWRCGPGPLVEGAQAQGQAGTQTVNSTTGGAHALTHWLNNSNASSIATMSTKRISCMACGIYIRLRALRSCQSAPVLRLCSNFLEIKHPALGTDNSIPAISPALCVLDTVWAVVPNIVCGFTCFLKRSTPWPTC